MKRRKQKLSDWQQLVTAYEASGQRQGEFARSKGVSVSALQHWLYRLRRERRQRKVGADVKFVEVKGAMETPKGKADRVEVELPSGIVIRLGYEVGGPEIADVVRHVQSVARC